MRVAIVGSRSFDDFRALYSFITRSLFVSDIELVVSGGAVGADRLGEVFADRFMIPCLVLGPDWSRYGRRAGFVRNKAIVYHCDVLFAFWVSQSRGTALTIDLARRQGKRLFVYRC